VRGREPLWAPWRMEYVGTTGDGGRACIFCDPSDAVQSVPDRERLILARSPRVLVFMNRYPYAAAHLMVAPADHTARVSELDPATRAELMERIAQTCEIVERVTACQGLNVGWNAGRAAGAGFADHLHVHVVPRWDGDTNFMTAIAELRVIPEHLDRTWEKLAPHFAELA
jgi:ATP adenylyltransferase